MRREPTTGEAALWAVLRGGRAGVRFRRQEQIGEFIVDFVCLAHRIVVEVDGNRHDNERRSGEDRRRDDELHRSGFTVLRVSEQDARDDPEGVADEIWSHLPGNTRVPSLDETAPDQ